MKIYLLTGWICQPRQDIKIYHNNNNNKNNNNHKRREKDKPLSYYTIVTEWWEIDQEGS